VSPLSQLDERTACRPPPSSEAVAALVGELRVQLGMALFGVDLIVSIHTHTPIVIDINIFPGMAAAAAAAGGRAGGWLAAARDRPGGVHSNALSLLSSLRLRGSAPVLLGPAQPHRVRVGPTPGEGLSSLGADGKSVFGAVTSPARFAPVRRDQTPPPLKLVIYT